MTWTAIPACNSAMPDQWGELRGADVLRLKDTKRSYWCNELLAADHFVYKFPKSPKATWECRLVDAIQNRHESLVVHLFSTPAARNEYHGEWDIDRIAPDKSRSNVVEMHLRRRPMQSTELADRYRETRGPHRSLNERLHHALIDQLFPPEDWVVAHEPETLLDLKVPSVVDGVAQTAAAQVRQYTCDFVVCHRRTCARLCIESKPTREHAEEPTAMAKCRLLRDKTLTRVAVVAGVGEDVTWLDVGAVGCAHAGPWTDFATFFQNAGLAE